VCFPIDIAKPLKFVFNPIKTTVPLHSPEVVGFEASVEATQEDADAAAAALEGLYATLPAGQQAVFAQILLQASSAAG
jgi:hypothetical protein